jgi:pimeloyl-ACP methyl ester carboxylesterase
MTLRSIFAAIFAFSALIGLQAQDPKPDGPLYGVDYEFDVVRTPLELSDRHDRGTVYLVSWMYTPKRHSSGGVTVVLHGSTGHLARSPKEAGGTRPPWLGQLLARGDMVVVPQRRGRGESGGAYVEECAFHAGDCSLEQINAGAEATLHDALQSTRAVLLSFVFPKLRPKDGKVSLWGVSRGGFLSLMYAGRYPDEVSEVVAVSPGWLSVAPQWGPAINDWRVGRHIRWLAQSGKRFKGPVLWVDGSVDRFYGADITAEFFAGREPG